MEAFARARPDEIPGMVLIDGRLLVKKGFGFVL
jgi:hypothetical protein